MRYLRTKPGHSALHELEKKAFVQAYSVLETYLQGNSMKNGLYFAKHIDYFSTQYGVAVSFLSTVFLSFPEKKYITQEKCLNSLFVECFFQGEIGEKATTMITELIRDNRKIIDRIPKEDIDRIIELVKKFKVKSYNEI